MRPPLADTNAHIERYDTILLSFPIWWFLPPLIVYTFLESYNKKKKKIILFPTSHTSLPKARKSESLVTMDPVNQPSLI